jgi:hypothetical protein
MPPAGFEFIISASERLKTYALDLAATETGEGQYCVNIKHKDRTANYYSLIQGTVVYSSER